MIEERVMFAAVVGRALRALRAQLDLTQGALADRTGISRSALSRFEHADAIPDVFEAAQLARAFDLTPGEFAAFIERAAASTKKMAKTLGQGVTKDAALALAQLGVDRALGPPAVAGGA